MVRQRVAVAAGSVWLIPRTAPPTPYAGTNLPSDAYMRIMKRAMAYLISIGIIGFGFWIFAKAGSGWPFLWIAGLAPIAVGLASIINEIHNDGAT
jgi:hypothetical protein